MRARYDKQLETMHNRLIHMGAVCEDVIANATKALLDGDVRYYEATVNMEHEIDLLEHEVEQLCVRLLLHEQPVARDLRHITAAQKMITDMERIGDQGRDIATLAYGMPSRTLPQHIPIADMARATIKMVTDCVNSFVHNNLDEVREVIAYDDVVDELFARVKSELVEELRRNPDSADECIDLLMIAKYFERIGDHAQNIAEWVHYSITGTREVDSPGESRA